MPELLRAKESAAFCGFGERYWHHLHKQRRVPDPVRLGRKGIFWLTDELRRWTAAGMPPAAEWAMLSSKTAGHKS